MNVSAADRHRSRQPVLESYLEVGFNYRMTDIQAAVGLVQLGKLDAMVAPAPRARRRATSELLADVPGLRAVRDPAWGTVELPVVLGRARPTAFPLSRNELLARSPRRASRRGAASWPRTAQPAYAGHPHGRLPVTERLTDTTLILPLYHQMTASRSRSVVVDVVRCGRRPAGRLMPTHRSDRARTGGAAS